MEVNVYILPVLFILTVVLYLLGIRIIGRPVAEWSWRFWMEEPHRLPSILSYLLYPLAHVTTPPRVIMQEYKLPDRSFSNRPLPGHTPLICQCYLYGERWGTSEGYVPGDGPVWVRQKLDRLDLEVYYTDAKSRYVRHASWAWPLRLAILLVCHVLAICNIPHYVYQILSRVYRRA